MHAGFPGEGGREKTPALGARDAGRDGAVGGEDEAVFRDDAMGRRDGRYKHQEVNWTSGFCLNRNEQSQTVLRSEKQAGVGAAFPVRQTRPSIDCSIKALEQKLTHPLTKMR